MQRLETPHGIARLGTCQLKLQHANGSISVRVEKSRLKKLPYLSSADGSPLVKTLLMFSDTTNINTLVERAKLLMGLEVSGPVQFINWRELRSNTMMERNTFLSLLNTKGRLNMSKGRLNAIEVENRPLTAKELVAFSAVYGIDLNQLKPKEV